MTRDYVLAGVGGQGVISLGALLAAAGRRDGLEVQLAEVHGMAQRGGAVQAGLRLSDQPIHGALIPEGSARGILSTEPLEGLRYLRYLAPNGVLVTATEPEVGMPEYPPIDELHARLRALPHAVLVDAVQLAREAGSRRATNVVLAGAASPYMPIRFETLEAELHRVFAAKGNEVIEINLRALHAGREAAACPAY
jgi:indolepyruvate ferredoxin oxidoreductase beta subunit